jgi:hypothetical protein
MAFEPYIEDRSEHYRQCNCGIDHQIKIIQGMFYYSEKNHVGFCVALINHSEEKHVWISFITGEWPGTKEEDCFVTSHIWSNSEGRTMKIADGTSSPFDSDEVFDCYPVTRDQVMAVEGAKNWLINTYLTLFEVDQEIGNFLKNSA